MSNVEKKHKQKFGRIEPKPHHDVMVRDLQRIKSGEPRIVPCDLTRNPDDFVTVLQPTIDGTYTVIISPFTNEVITADGDVSQDAGQLLQIARKKNWGRFVRIKN
jgi:hypothetical protein